MGNGPPAARQQTRTEIATKVLIAMLETVNPAMDKLELSEQAMAEKAVAFADALLDALGNAR
jgi:hypothetical protein